MSSPTLTKDSVDEKVSQYNNCADSSEHVQSSEYVNYYDNESYVVEQLKTEFPEDVLPQSDCSLNTQIHSENEELLKFIAKAELNNENIEDRVLLNIKEENDYKDYQFIVKREGLDEQEDVQSKFYDKALNNGCNVLQNSKKHIKMEITTPLDNGITKLHQCQYCGMGFDDYNNMLVHISNDHKHEKSKCDICGKQFKSVGNLNRHILAFHKLDKPLKPITENGVNCHMNVQHKCPLNDHSKLSCSDKEDESVKIKNKVTRNIRSDGDYGTMLECRGKQHHSSTHLCKRQKLIHGPKISKTNNEGVQCDSCKKNFKTKWSLTRHIKGMHFECGRKFECSCGKQYRSPMYLRKHERLMHRRNVQNTNIGKFQCDYCNIFIRLKSKLLAHILRVHYVYGKSFGCWCGKQYRSPIHLREHEKNMHRRNGTDKSKFQCNSCKKKFTFKSNLNSHIKKVHFDYGRTFACWCGKQFRSPLYLTGHKRRIHGSSIFQCDYCKVFFKYKTLLVSHIKRLHYDYGKRFDCWCGKQFRSSLHLTGHKRRIHGSSSFQCDYCKVFFKYKTHLLLHIKRLHYDYGKRFDCWCGKQYRSPIHLREHEKNMHGRNGTDKSKFQCN